MGNSPFPAGHGLARHKQLLRECILRQSAFCPQLQKHVFGFHWNHPPCHDDTTSAFSAQATACCPVRIHRTCRRIKAPPHNSAARLALSFPPSAACRFLDLPPVNLRNLHLHLTKNPFASRPPHLCGVTLNFIRRGQIHQIASTRAEEAVPVVIRKSKIHIIIKMLHVKFAHLLP